MFSLFKKPGPVRENSSAGIGQAGERIAESYLLGRGCTVLERNYRKRFGEIDIIVEDDDVLVFVEVKTRSSNSFGSPLEAVDARKQQRMARAAHAYMSESGAHDRPARFDVIAVQLARGGQPHIEHIRNAFELR